MLNSTFHRYYFPDFLESMRQIRSHRLSHCSILPSRLHPKAKMQPCASFMNLTQPVHMNINFRHFSISTTCRTFPTLFLIWVLGYQPLHRSRLRTFAKFCQVVLYFPEFSQNVTLNEMHRFSNRIRCMFVGTELQNNFAESFSKLKDKIT